MTETQVRMFGEEMARFHADDDAFMPVLLDMKALNPHFDDVICGIIVIRRSTRQIVYVNRIALQMIGSAGDEILGHICHKVVCPADHLNCPIIDLGKTVDLSEKILLARQERPVPILKKVREVEINGEQFLLESFTDITAQKKYEDELVMLCETDTLTGLKNRAHLTSSLNNHGMDRRRSAAVGCNALLIVDIDHFKVINDRYGHSCGDEVLKRLSTVLKAATREDDLLIRWGGEEFLIWVCAEDPRMTSLLAERLREKIMAADFYPVERLTVSIGVAIQSNGESFHEWFTRADACLYQAKQTGRNRVCLDDYTPDEIRQVTPTGGVAVL